MHNNEIFTHFDTAFNQTRKKRKSVGRIYVRSTGTAMRPNNEPIGIAVCTYFNVLKRYSLKFLTASLTAIVHCAYDARETQSLLRHASHGEVFISNVVTENSPTSRYCDGRKWPPGSSVRLEVFPWATYKTEN